MRIKIKINKVLFTLFMYIFYLVITGYVGLSWAKENTKDAPPVITSDTIEMLQKGKIVAFKGNVKLVKGNTVITADEMVNFVDEDRVEGKGNVHCISIGEQKEVIEIKSGFVKYFDKDKIAILTGNPWAYQDTKDDKGEYKGDKMTIFTEEERLIIEGNAKAIIYPKQKPRKYEGKGKEK